MPSKPLLLISSFTIVVVAAFGLHATWGLPAVLLLLAGAALCSVIALVWHSLTSLSGDADLSFEEALSLAAPTVEEEQKRAVLRALKDLEYELFVGKISREDYDELSSKYRADARQLIARADESLGQRMQLAEERLQALLEGGATGQQSPGRKGKKRHARRRGADLTTTSEETPRARRKAATAEADADADADAERDDGDPEDRP